MDRSPFLPEDAIAEAIESHWGPRCVGYNADCATCVAWAELDALRCARAELREALDYLCNLILAAQYPDAKLVKAALALLSDPAKWGA